MKRCSDEKFFFFFFSLIFFFIFFQKRERKTKPFIFQLHDLIRSDSICSTTDIKNAIQPKDHGNLKYENIKTMISSME